MLGRGAAEEPDQEWKAMSEPDNPRPPVPKMTVAILLVTATVFVFGLGMAVGGDEWRKVGGFQPGIAMVVAAVLVSFGTALLHLAYCKGWNRRGLQMAAS